MSTHEAIAALPTTGSASKSLIRAMATRRFAYCLDLGEAATSFTAVDPASGTLPLYIIQNNILFRYDSTDSTTANDGTTCLVTADGKRYKVSSVAFPYSVLSVTTSAQPASPSVGDKYLVPTAATGADWSGKDGQIATYTARGWVFNVAQIGRLLYNEATDSFYHKAASGTWTLGFGTQSLGAGTVLPSNMSGGGGKVRWFVENQTTNTPPGSPTSGVEYIIGSSPTGAWAGKAGQIARYETSAWVYYVPAAGWKAYDKALASDVQFNGTSWASALGAWLDFSSVVTDDNTNTSGGSTGTEYNYSDTVAPTQSGRCLIDGNGITYTARRSGAKIRLTYQAHIQTGSGPTYVTVALFRDSESNAIKWVQIWHPAVGDNVTVWASFIVTSADALSHTYKFAIMAQTATSVAGALRREMTLEGGA